MSVICPDQSSLNNPSQDALPSVAAKMDCEPDSPSCCGSDLYIARQELAVDQTTAFAYHERPGCLSRLTPPWENVTVEHSDQSIEVGSRVTLKTRIAGIPLRWKARHVWYDPPNGFADVQDSGPFAHWHHQHRFESLDHDRSCLVDSIEYRLPAGWIGRTLGGGKARRTIEAMFAYRHRITRDDLQLIADYPMQSKTIAVSGATGLVGDALCSMLTLLGHKVMKITRDETGDADEIAAWGKPEEMKKFEGVDAVVHLAGKPLVGKRWTPEIKEQIRESRVEKTRALCEGLAKLENKPSVFICASATGIYGDRGEEILDEDSATGDSDDFLASVAKQWEDACSPAKEAGIRAVHTRFGIILSPDGGALEQMLLPAKMMGGKLGDGKQWWSWIALEDALGAIVHCIATPQVHGPVNFVSPEPIRNRDFARTLGRVLHRPALFPAPKFALRLALGEMADDLLLASFRVLPKQLQQSGYQFRFAELEDCLRFYLGKHRKPSQEVPA